MMQKKISIVGVGPQKTATSWLAEVLAATPRLCFPTGVKETFFWDRQFDRGLDWYLGHFKDEGRCIEFGPTYFHSPEAVARLQAHNPDLQVIVTLRDPAARAWSLYQHHHRKGRVGDNFESAAAEIPAILDASRYGTHLPRWREAFGPDRVLVLLQSDVQRVPDAVLSRVTQFIGEDLDTRSADLGRRVNVAGRPPSRKLAAISTHAAEILRRVGLYGVVNLAKTTGLKKMVYGGAGTGVDRLPEDLRAQLVDEFKEDIAFVEDLLEVDLAQWRQKHA